MEFWVHSIISTSPAHQQLLWLWGNIQRAGSGAPPHTYRFRSLSQLPYEQIYGMVKRLQMAYIFLLSVAFWNFLGAGIFGFIINPPIALYYMQGLNTTPVHGHAALFGVYGMLGSALFCLCFAACIANKNGITSLSHLLSGLSIPASF